MTITITPAAMSVTITTTALFPPPALQAISEHVIPGRPWLEFGVYMGASLRELNPIVTGPFWGFDSFLGLPEHWIDPYTSQVHAPKGYFACEPPTDIPNVTLVVGLFQDTLPGWLAEHGEPLGFVHMDCDLYSSTKYVLEQLAPYLDGAVVALDECRGPSYCEDVEGRAWREFLTTGWRAALVCEQHGCAATYKLTKGD